MNTPEEVQRAIEAAKRGGHAIREDGSLIELTFADFGIYNRAAARARGVRSVPKARKMAMPKGMRRRSR